MKNLLFQYENETMITYVLSTPFQITDTIKHHLLDCFVIIPQHTQQMCGDIAHNSHIVQQQQL
jgi:hypothetical protein